MCFKILAAPSPTGLNYNVQTTDGRPYLRVEKVPVSLYQAIKAVGLFSTDCAYWIKALDGTVLGYVNCRDARALFNCLLKFSGILDSAKTRQKLEYARHKIHDESS